MAKKQMTEQEFHELLYDALNFEDEGEVYTMTIERLKALCEQEEPDEESVRYAKEMAAELAREARMERAAKLAQESEMETAAKSAIESEMETSTRLAKESEMEVDKMSEMKTDKTFNVEFGEMFDLEFSKVSEPQSEKALPKESYFTNPRTKRIIGIAAALLIVVAVIASMSSSLIPRVDASKDKEKAIQLQGNTQVHQGTAFNDEEALGYKEWEKDKWENVPDAVKFLPELLIPSYIPEGYEFERLYIKKYEDERYLVEYEFSNETERIYMTQAPFTEAQDEFLMLEDYDTLVKTDKGDLQISLTETDKPIGSIYFNEIKIKILGCASAEEVERIVNGLE